MCAVDERHIVEFVEEGVLNVRQCPQRVAFYAATRCGARGSRCAWSAIWN